MRFALGWQLCIVLYHIETYRIVSHHISYHIISYIISYHIIYHITSYHIISYHIIISFHIISYISHVMPRHITSHHIILHHVYRFHFLLFIIRQLTIEVLYNATARNIVHYSKACSQQKIYRSRIGTLYKVSAKSIGVNLTCRAARCYECKGLGRGREVLENTSLHVWYYYCFPHLWVFWFIITTIWWTYLCSWHQQRGD